MAPVNLNRFVYFVSVVDAGSFTSAADRLGVAKAVVSHQIAKLEAELGTTLLIRTTRRLRTTEAGQNFYEKCAAVLRQAEEAIDSLTTSAETPTGTLTLTAPLDYGARVVAAAIARFVADFPQMKVHLSFDDTRFDLVEKHLDLSVRVGWLDDSSAQARRIGTFRQQLVCSPAFAETIARISEPAELADVNWIENGALRQPGTWEFRGTNERSAVVTGRPVVRAESTEACYVCALAGAGLAVLPYYLVSDDIAGHRLVEVLPDWTLPSGGIHIVFPPARYRPSRVTAFVDILTRLERSRRS